MATLAELCRTRTGLGEDDVAHLQDLTGSWALLADLSFAQRDWDKAQEYYDRLIELDPRSEYLRMEYAQVLVKYKRYEKALEQYELRSARVEALAASLGMSVPAFLRQYARRLNGRWSLQERRTEHGLDCIFLDRGTLPGKAVCSVYETRPAQCSAWPFWKENLASPEAWESARRKTPCPGIGCGPRIMVDRIRILRDSVPGSSGDD